MEWVLILVFQASSGTAVTTVPGYHTAAQCMEQAKWAQARRLISGAYCISRPKPDGRPG